MPGLSSGMWGLMPLTGMEPGSPALGAQSHSHWTSRKVPLCISQQKSNSSQLV